jgi:hypothetical protein
MNRTDAQLAGRVPILFSHGMGMNDGWMKGLRGAEDIADVTGRPVIYFAEMTGGSTSQTMTLKASGNIFSGAGVDDIALAGANLASWTWEGAWVGPDTGPASYYSFANVWLCGNGDRAYRSLSGEWRCMSCGGWWADSEYQTGLNNPKRQPACYLQNRARSTYVGSAPWTLQAVRDRLIAYGFISATQKIDVMAHSTGAIYVAAAIANHNGKLAGPTTTNYANLYSAIRNIVTANGMHLGVIDAGAYDGEGFRSNDPWSWFPTSRPTFIKNWRANARFAGVRWYAIRTASCARENPNKATKAESWPLFWSPMDANYVFGYAVNKENTHELTQFCGSKRHQGDGVVPTVSQSSPWVNSYGFAETTCGKTTYTYKSLSFDCSPANYSPATGWKGNHRWLITTREGMSNVLQTLNDACNNSGASCQYEVPCYTGPAGTEKVGICRGGHRYTNESTGVCHGEILPQDEVCDSQDNNCDGQIDENGGTQYGYVDHDGDTIGAGDVVGYPGCYGFSYPGYSFRNDDCDDTNAAAFPGASSRYRTFPRELADGSLSYDFTCSGIEDPHCTDGTCQWGDENQQNCPQDCGYPVTYCYDMYGSYQDCNYGCNCTTCYDSAWGWAECPYSCTDECTPNDTCIDSRACDAV